MKITYDPNKRLATLQDRALDFDDAGEVFVGGTIDVSDERFDYGERRIISFGMSRDPLVVIGRTHRGSAINTDWTGRINEVLRTATKLKGRA